MFSGVKRAILAIGNTFALLVIVVFPLRRRLMRERRIAPRADVCAQADRNCEVASCRRRGYVCARAFRPF